MNKILFTVLLACSLAGITFEASAASSTVVIRSEASIKAMLELAISETGNSELSFGNIRAGGAPAETGPFKINVDITSNTGERYQLTQRINGPLQNAEGEKIGVENLKFKSSSTKSVGTGVPELQPLIAEPQAVFTSDSAGASDTISIDYFLTIPPFQAPGDYSALITYTVSAL